VQADQVRRACTEGAGRPGGGRPGLMGYGCGPAVAAGGGWPRRSPVAGGEWSAAARRPRARAMPGPCGLRLVTRLIGCLVAYRCRTCTLIPALCSGGVSPAARANVSATSAHSFCHACRSASGSRPRASGPRTPANSGAPSQRSMPRGKAQRSCSSNRRRASSSARSQSRACPHSRVRSFSPRLPAFWPCRQPARATAQAAL
jgi:hypothetical protein